MDLGLSCSQELLTAGAAGGRDELQQERGGGQEAPCEAQHAVLAQEDDVLQGAALHLLADQPAHTLRLQLRSDDWHPHTLAAALEMRKILELSLLTMVS